MLGESRGTVEARHPNTRQLPARAAGGALRDAYLPSECSFQGTLIPPPFLSCPTLFHLNLSVAKARRLLEQTGEICLDLLKTSWSPAYTITQTLSSIHQLLTDPEPDSPLNVDVASLLRQGDRLGAEGLARFYTGEYRWQG